MLTRAVDGNGNTHYAFGDDPGYADRRYCPYCNEPVRLTTSKKKTKYYRIVKGEHNRAYCRKLAHTKAHGTLSKKAIISFFVRFLTPEPDPRAKDRMPEEEGTIARTGGVQSNRTISASEASGTNISTAVSESSVASLITMGNEIATGKVISIGEVAANNPHAASSVSPFAASSGVRNNCAAVNEPDETDDESPREIRKPKDIYDTGFLDDIAAGNPSVGPLKILKERIVYYPWAQDIAEKIRKQGGEYIVACRLVSAATTKTGNYCYGLRVFWRTNHNTQGKSHYDELYIRAYCNRHDIADLINKRLPPQDATGKYVRHTCLLIAKLKSKDGKLQCEINNRNQITFNLED